MWARTLNQFRRCTDTGSVKIRKTRTTKYPDIFTAYTRTFDGLGGGGGGGRLDGRP